MPDDILAGQRAECNVIDLPENIHGNFKAAPGIKGKILLRQVTRNDDPGTEPDTGQEHLHLRGRGILRLVEDNKRVVQRPAPHVCKRRYLNRTLFGILRVTLRPHDLIEGVVERTQVRIDLALKIAGKKSQFLAGFYRRPGHDDPGYFFISESSDRHSHRQIRLSGSGRTNPESDHMIPDSVDILLLAISLGTDRLSSDRMADDIAIDL